LARLQDDPLMASGTPEPVLRTWRDWIGTSMRLLASGRTDLPARPAGTENDTLARLARQIELMSGAMERLR
jgi:hypothetical protein